MAPTIEATTERATRSPNTITQHVRSQRQKSQTARGIPIVFILHTKHSLGRLLKQRRMTIFWQACMDNSE